MRFRIAIVLIVTMALALGASLAPPMAIGASTYFSGLRVGSGNFLITNGTLTGKNSLGVTQYTFSAAGALTLNNTVGLTLVNAASGSANPFDYTGTLGIMNGSDDFTLFDVNLTNADHTGSGNTVQVLDIAGITGDAHATETAINIGSGWDTGITSASAVSFSSTLAVTGALSLGAGTGAIVVPASSGAVGKAIGATAGDGNGGTTAGYAGGAISTTGGTGSAGTTTGGAGGATTVTSGNGGTSVTGTTGAGGAVTLTAGTAGAASGAGTSGAAGAISIAGGAGGSTVAGTSAAGGAVNITGGTGSGGTPATGGVGGAVTLTAGTGGAGTTGGVGGSVNIYTGIAGAGGSPDKGQLTVKMGGASGTTALQANQYGQVVIPMQQTANDTSAARVCTSSDYGKLIILSYAGAIGITLPANGATAGSHIDFICTVEDAGTLTVSPVTADTLITANSSDSDAVTFATGHRIGAYLRCISVNLGGPTVWAAMNLGNTTMGVIDTD